MRANFRYFVVIAMFLLGCSIDISRYENTEPRLDIKRYFTGKVTAWGIVQDRNDQVIRRFCVDILGQWQGNNGTLEETFYFDDGEVSYRTWRLTKFDDGSYQGTADDVIGIATGRQQGFAFHWQYQLKVSSGGTIYEMMLDDWMYQIDEYRLFNRTEMKKFGFTLASITLFFDKQPAISPCADLGSNQT